MTRTEAITHRLNKLSVNDRKWIATITRDEAELQMLRLSYRRQLLTKREGDLYDCLMDATQN